VVTMGRLLPQSAGVEWEETHSMAIAHVVWKRVGLTEGRLSVAMARVVRP